MILVTLSVILAAIAAVAGWYFVYLYWREPWRSLEAGRHLMRFTLGLAVILTWSVAGIVLRVIWPHSERLELILAVGRIFIFGWAALMLIQRILLLRKVIRARTEFFERNRHDRQER